MKKWLFFGGGVLTGFVLTILLALVINHYKNGVPYGVTNFEKPGKVIDEKSVKVFQVIRKNAALVRGQDDDRHPDWYYGAVYLLRNYEGKYYYDDEIINKPIGKKFVQTGIYEYNTDMGSGYKTVAIIELR